MDKDAERKYKFQLKESLAKAKTKRLLDGYNVLVTPSVKPGPQEMKGSVLLIIVILLVVTYNYRTDIYALIIIKYALINVKNSRKNMNYALYNLIIFI